MKKFAFMMMAAIIAAVSFCAAPSANAASRKAPSKSSVLALIPEAVVVEQTATLADGTTVTVYYKKSGNICEVYSPSDLSGYSFNDLASLQATSFRIVGSVKGQKIYSTTMAKAGKIIKSLVNTYL